MAEIYDYADGYQITVGLQGCSVCDEAFRAAKSVAKERYRAVELHDDDGVWYVGPRGGVRKLRDLDADSATDDWS